MTKAGTETEKMSTANRTLAEYMAMSYRVELQEDDDGITVSNPDLPGCISYGETPDEAIRNLREIREMWFEGRLQAGMDIPLPTAEIEFSGRFVLRVGKSLHKQLNDEAAREKLSLNTYLVQVLSERHKPLDLNALAQAVVSNLPYKMHTVHTQPWKALYQYPREQEYSLGVPRLGQYVPEMNWVPVDWSLQTDYRDTQKETHRHETR